MPYIHPSNMIMLDTMGTNFKLVAHKLLCTMKKRIKNTLLTYILFIGNYYTKDGRNHTTGIWLGWKQITAKNHTHTNITLLQIVG